VSQNARKYLVAVGLAAVCSLVAIPAVAQITPAPVNVENTPSVHVTNTPSVSVANTPSVHVANTPSVSVINTPSVHVANTPSVNVANTPSVNVTNTPTVQLTNLPSNPIPTWALDEPGRIPFVAYSSNTCSGTGCDYTFPAVRAGHRVVLQHVSAGLVFNTSPTTLLAAAVDGGNGAIFFNVPLPPGLNFTAFDHELLLYFDAGQTPLVQINSDGIFNPSAGQNLTLVGYELDCNAAPCAAITNQ
jgi:hypothetical protein